MDIIDKLGSLIPSDNTQMILLLAGLFDFLLRLTPSKKPLSVLHVIARASKSAGLLLTKLGDLLDRVLPQIIKDDK